MATMSKEIYDEIVNDPIKYMKHILGMGDQSPIFPRIFPFQTYTKSEPTVVERKTRKAEFKLIEYKPEEK